LGSGARWSLWHGSSFHLRELVMLAWWHRLRKRPRLAERCADLGDCSVCLEESAATHALCPCGHQACCAACAALVRQCPICRVPVVNSIRIYAVASSSRLQQAEQQVVVEQEAVRSAEEHAVAEEAAVAEHVEESLSRRLAEAKQRQSAAEENAAAEQVVAAVAAEMVAKHQEELRQTIAARELSEQTLHRREDEARADFEARQDSEEQARRAEQHCAELEESLSKAETMTQVALRGFGAEMRMRQAAENRLKDMELRQALLQSAREMDWQAPVVIHID